MRCLFEFVCHPVGILTCDAVRMNDYIIGAGALLTSGQSATISWATLHAQTDPALASSVRAALVDFESTSARELARLLLIAPGFDARRFESSVVVPLLARRECSLTDVLLQLARGADACEVHVFAAWLPDEATATALAREGVTLVAHPLQTIRAAALVCGQLRRRWPTAAHVRGVFSAA